MTNTYQRPSAQEMKYYILTEIPDRLGGVPGDCWVGKIVVAGIRGLIGLVGTPEIGGVENVGLGEERTLGAFGKREVFE